MREPSRADGARPAAPLFAATALIMPVIVAGAWVGLVRGADDLGYAAPMATGAAFVFIIMACGGGALAAVVGLMRGERPVALPLIAAVANVAALMWVFGAFTS